MEVVGDGSTGYIVIPGPPTVRPRPVGRRLPLEYGPEPDLAEMFRDHVPTLTEEEARDLANLAREVAKRGR